MGSCLSSSSGGAGAGGSANGGGNNNTGAASQRQGYTDVTQNAANGTQATDNTTNASSSGRARRSDRRSGGGGRSRNNDNGNGTTRERSSLERQNTEAREALMVGSGAAPKFKRHGGWEARPAVTRSQLALTRRAFWETADTFGGRRETWEVLQRAVDSDDLATAQALIDGADIRLLGDGDLVHGCYDPTGFHYKVPEPCLSDPINLIPDDEDDDDYDEAELEKLHADYSSATGAPPLSAATDTTASDAAIDDAKLVDMKVRMSHTSQDIVVRVSPQERVSTVAKKVKAQTGVESLKLMCLGRMLRDDSNKETLETAGWRQGLVVQALVTKV